jgi:Ca2+-binding RTX toxin-like protein
MTRRLALAASISLVCAGALSATTQAADPGANGRIAFSREPALGQPDVPEQIFAVNADQSAFGPITGAIDASDPAWSPNGGLIAYEAPDPAETNRSRIWVAGADGSAPHEVAPQQSTSDFSPSWSPDGTRLVFDRQYWSGTTITKDDLEIANADGSGSATAIPGTDSEQSPAWSPDGVHIAFAHYTGSASYTLVMVRTDGTGAVTLDTPTALLTDGYPAWSPDGRTVFFTRGQEAVGCSSQSQIYAVAADAPNTAVIVSQDPSFSDYQPAPSPDGSKVAFVRCDDETDNVHHIYTMNVDGTGVLPATSGNTVDDYFPDWQPTPPQFTSSPTITGMSVNNKTLTAAAGSTLAGLSVSLQFERCDPHGSACIPIPGASASRAHTTATSVSYKLTSADLGHTVRVRETAGNQAGTNMADSSPTGSVAPSRGHCSNRFVGSAHADRIKGSSGSDRIAGGRGRDHLSGLAGADCISGSAGNDVLSGGNGADTVSGGPGSDRITGGAGNDKLSGGSGNDTITAGPGSNKVSGGAGNDRINVRNHRRDVVNCGKGKKDRVIADKRDKLRGCEIVRRSRR